jgi:hypothetical protein
MGGLARIIPSRNGSYRSCRLALFISMAQQAMPNNIGHMENGTAQLTI